jgi:hypothetical protein
MLGNAQQATTATVQAGGAITAALVPASMIPVVGIAVAGITLALSFIFNRRGPQQKVASTRIVDELEPQLRANVDAYTSGPRTAASQQQALANFDNSWAFLTSNQACGSPELGNPGRACISDRARGGRWDWFALYRDPIAVDTPRPFSQAISQQLGIDTQTLLTAAALVALAVIL